MRSATLILLGLALVGGMARGEELAVYDLRVDRLTDARQTGAKPVFSWKIRSDRQGARQSAYRLTVRDRADALVWDSGERSSDETLEVAYDGAPLAECSPYRWRVSVRDETQRWTESAVGAFQTGFLAPDFWEGSCWITPRETNACTTAAFGRRFVNEKAVREAFWCMSGLGVFDAFVNGRRVGSDVLKPGFTEAQKCRHAFTYDVTRLLATQVGATNDLSALVSGGWWCDELRGFPPWNPSKGRLYPKVPGFRAQLVLRYGDGTEKRIGTGTDWHASFSGPVVKAGIWEGETYDARRSVAAGEPAAVDRTFAGEIRNFVGPGVVHRDDLALTPQSMCVVRGVAGADTNRFGDAVVVRRVRAGEKIDLAPEETLIVDFGQNAAAVPDFTVEGSAGTRLVIRHGEMLNEPGGVKSRGNDGPGGTLYLANLRGISASVDYTLREGLQSYRPHHSFFGFRYAAVTASAPVTLHALKAVPVTSVHREDEAGSLETSDPSVNRLIANVRWGQLSNYLSVPTDCPQRNERLGWTGDTQAFAAAATRNADVYGFLRKWLADLRDGQMTNGAYCCVAPDGRWKHIGAMAGWCDAGIIVPYVLWKRYGDRSAMAEGWDSMCRYMAHLERHSGHDRHNFGDWLAYEHAIPGKDMHNQPVAYKKCLSVFYWIMDAAMMREMAEALDRKDAAAHYRTVEQAARDVYARTYRGEDGQIREEYRGQTTSLFVLRLGLAPNEDAARATRAYLLRNIREHGNCLQTGFLGTSVLMETLSDAASAPEMAWTLLLQRKDPSWLYSVDQGATTIWERWNSYTRAKGFGPVAMNSFNHYAYGSVLEWIYAFAAGIRPDPKSAGYRHFILAPQPDRRMRSVAATFESPVGTIRSAWQYEGGNWRWRFAIPANASATVVSPDGKAREYAAGSHEIVVPSSPQRPWRIVNLDNDFYFTYATSPDDIAEERFVEYIDRIVDGGRVTHCFFCVCGQRTSYASKVWEPIWAGANEPDAQGKTNNPWCVYAKLAAERGLDPWATWIRRCREKGVSPFMSMRMNDVHYTDRPVTFRSRRFWREHPEFRRHPNAGPKAGRPWNDYALDYTHPEVRDDALAMVKEILDRWDADGLELDWMRFSLHLTPGHEAECAGALTDVMRRCRARVREAEKARGHRIALAVRVPSTWGSALGLGYDLPTWLREGLVDMVIPCNTHSCSDFDMDLPEWRRNVKAANGMVAVVPGTDICVSCDWRTKPYYFSQLPFLYGWCALAQRDNPDGVYFYNLPHLKDIEPDVCHGDLSFEAVSRRARRFPVTWHDNGFQSRNRNWRQLPRTFTSSLTLRAYAAKGAEDECADVVVSFAAPQKAANVALALNGHGGEGVVSAQGNYGRNAACSFKARFPIAQVRDGENEIVIRVAVTSAVEAVWAELALPPARGEVRLWPNGCAPHAKPAAKAESMTERTRDHVFFCRDVSVPTLTFFPAGRGRPDHMESPLLRPALVVCPGGGYGALAWNKEGTEIATWLNGLGYSAFVLKYRVPDNPDGALCDIQRAMGLIRAKAEAYGVDAQRLGVIGFSAGGNLAARLSCNWSRRAYAPLDAADAFPCRPDFALLIYPWALVEGADAEKNLPLTLRPQFAVTRETPPTFLVQAMDDPFHAENALAYAAAFKRSGAECELHVYPRGSHGFGVRAKNSPVGAWPSLAAAWLSAR